MRVYFSAGPDKKQAETKRGTYEMRGRQIATLRPEWTTQWEDGCYPVDVFVMVKKIDPRATIAKRIVYDVIDPWGQKDGRDDGAKIPNDDAAREYFKRRWRWRQFINVNGYIFTNRVMRKHMEPLTEGAKTITIYHHYQPGIALNPVREQALYVGYQGKAIFLAEWADKLDAICKRLGMTFVVNPKSLARVDIAVAVRGGIYANFFSHKYKSNIKLANCYGSGTPCVVWPEASYLETACPEVRFFETERELEDRLAELRDYKLRCRIHEAFLNAAPNYSIDRIILHYERFFSDLLAA